VESLLEGSTQCRLAPPEKFLVHILREIYIVLASSGLVRKIAAWFAVF